MKIFLLSSAIIENSFISNLEYMIDRNITEIVMLQENHTVTEYSKYSKNTIILCNTILEATEICDAAIIISPPDIQNHRYEAIYDYIKERIQETYYIDLASCLQRNEISTAISCSTDIPTILILAIGRFHQVQNLELSLNELFSRKKVHFSQHFSPTTSMILEEFKNKKLLSKEIENSLYTSSFELKITTLCSESLEAAFNDLSLLETVHKLDPSYVFFVSERNPQDKQEYLEAFQNRLNYKLDSILYSDYLSISWDEIPTPILITNRLNLYLREEDKELIWNEITKKIAFPSGVKVIRANR